MPPPVRPRVRLVAPRLVAIDMDGTLLPTTTQAISPRNAQALHAAQQAGITVAIATGRRVAYTTPLLAGLNLRADMPLIASNGAVIRTLGGDPISCCYLEARVARGICGLVRPFGTLVFTFDRPGRGELALEDLDEANNRFAIWVEANRNAIEIVKPLELALADGCDPIQGMVAGKVCNMRQAEEVLRASEWNSLCESVRTEYLARDLAILDLLPRGVSKGRALEQLAGYLGVDRAETMAIGDNWNDVDMLKWAGQSILMGNAAAELRTMAQTLGWEQAPTNDRDGVAVVLERVLAQLDATRA
jgi:Cof subfamily protein (haloacid dehalogenase superfamily)